MKTEIRKKIFHKDLINESSLIQEELKLSKVKNHFSKLVGNKKINKIFFVNPPDVDGEIFDYDVAKRGRANNYPAYGLGVLSSQMREKNYITDMINLNHEVLREVFNCDNKKNFNFNNCWKNLLKKKINDFQPDIIGVSCLFSLTHKSFKAVCNFIKETYPSIPLILGGFHVSHDLENILKDIKSADGAVIFEADLALSNLIEIMNNQKDTKELAQFGFMDKEELVVFKKKLVPEGECLNVIPAFDQMDIRNHSNYGTLGSWHEPTEGRKVVGTSISNRGCRAACTFCSVRNFNGKTVRHKSVQAVVDELKCLQNDHGVQHIVWLDDDLLKDEKRSIQMFNEMVKQGLKLTWGATNGVIAHSLKSLELLEAAHKSGCIELYIGIESGNPEILKQIRKPGTVETFLMAGENLNKFPEIVSRAFLMHGFPNEDLSAILDTIQLAENLKFNWYNLSLLQPWKGTPIYEEMSADGLLGMKEGTIKDGKNVTITNVDAGTASDENNTNAATYQLGTYSKQRQIEMGLLKVEDKIQKEYLQKVQAKNFKYIPNAADLDYLWFYTNFRVNFARLFLETRKDKIKQQYNFLNYLYNKTAPDNALVIYFLGFMQYKFKGTIDKSLISHLKSRLRTEYWDEHFSYFGLHSSHLETKVFPKSINSAGTPKGWEDKIDRFNFASELIV